MNMHFGEPAYFHCLWLIPALIIFYVWAFRRKKRALFLFGGTELIDKLAASRSRRNQIWKIILSILGIFFLILALVRPQLGAKLKLGQSRGVDVVILLDTSLSMLSEDIKPNRLERAKYGIRDLIDKLGGNRIGIVSFAGESYIECPLTLDYSTAQSIVDGLDTTSVQGTAVGDAIRMASSLFNKKDLKYKVMVIFSDGESHESDITSAAEIATDEGVVIHAVGVGTKKGDVISFRQKDGNVEYKKDRAGNVVVTRLMESNLQRIAFHSGGIYQSMRESEPEEIYEEISKMEKKELQSRKYTKYEDRFQYVLVFSIAALIIESITSDRRRLKAEWKGRFQ